MEFYEIKHQLNYYECDPAGHPTLSTLINLAVLAAEADNQVNGVGLATVNQFGGGWVIINYAGNLSVHTAHKEEELRIGTRVESYNKFFIIRDFYVKGPDDQIYAEFKGTFVFMDLVKRKIMTIPQAVIDLFDMDPVRRLPRLPQPGDFERSPEWNQQTYRVRYFDIDMNGHVNNAHYFDWMLDPLGGEFLSHHHLVAMRITFAKEVRMDEIITSSVSIPTPLEDGRLMTQHLIEVDGEISAKGENYWIPLEKRNFKSMKAVL